MTAKRKGNGKAKRAPTPARDYPAGFFTEPVRAWAQLRYEGPLTMTAGVHGEARFADMAKRGRRKANEDGSGWGKATIVLPNTPKYDAPAWLPRPRSGG